ncbi:MAG: hypothetical protein HY785_17910, partial [Oscillatoriophycideae cyanobacterium NC_groundwater_1537_Pr4_S-0.65um_50_18]|nr:hypothetical protein [Oscillatoriophycideae cyanobacterium NC_groundwater_1537_Pr4_S-0.65um_50_18]
ARPGETVKYEIKTTGVNGYSGPITLQMPQLPAGITGELSPLTVQAGRFSTFIVTAATPLAPQSHTWTITGSATMQNRTVTHDTSITLTIIGSGHDFTVGATSTEATVTAGEAANYTITSTGLGGFTGPISLSVEGLPDGATFAFGQSSITAGSSTSLLVTTPAELEAGTYPLTVTGTTSIDAQPITRSIQLVLIIEDTNQKNFSFSISPTSLVVVPNESATLQVTVIPASNFSSQVRFTVDGLPDGISATFDQELIPPVVPINLTVSANSDVPAGQYSFLMTGTEDGNSQLFHTREVSFVVAGQDVETSISGVILSAELTPQPLVGVTVSSYGNPFQQVITDAQGRFTLSGITEDTKTTLLIDGRTVSIIPHSFTYPLVPIDFPIIPRTFNQIAEPIYLQQLSIANRIPIQQNIGTEQILTTPQIPNLKIIVPPNTYIVDVDGTPLTYLTVTSTHGSRMPKRQIEGQDLNDVSQVFTLYPLGAAATNNLKYVLPNRTNSLPGDRCVFWVIGKNLSQARAIGVGKITQDGLQVETNQSIQSQNKVSRKKSPPKQDQNPLDDQKWRMISEPFYYQMTEEWCEEQAGKQSTQYPKIIKLSVTPSKMYLTLEQSATFMATLTLSDGRELDVTHLCTTYSSSTYIEGLEGDRPHLLTSQSGLIRPNPELTMDVHFGLEGWEAFLGVYLEKIPAGIVCDNPTVFYAPRSIRVLISNKALLLRVESDYSPVISSADVAFVRNGHPAVLKARFQPGTGGDFVSLRTLGTYTPGQPRPFTPLVLFEGTVSQQEVSIPLPESLFANPGHTAVIYGYIPRSEGCQLIGAFKVSKFPNIKIDAIPNPVPTATPNPNTPYNTETIVDAGFSVTNDLPGVKIKAPLHLLKNGVWDLGLSTGVISQCSAGSGCNGFLPSGYKIDLQANYEVIMFSHLDGFSYPGYEANSIVASGYYSHDPCDDYGYIGSLYTTFDNAYYQSYLFNYDEGVNCDTGNGGCLYQIAQAPLLFGNNAVVKYEDRVVVRKEVVNDEVVCTTAANYFARLAKPSHVKITQIVLGTQEVVLEGDYPEGDVVHPVPPQLPFGQHKAVIEVTPLEGNSPIEIYNIQVSVEYVENNLLPVGHTFVKGIDLADGHVVQSATDFVLPGRGLSLEMTRTYSNVSIVRNSPFGAGWSDSFHMRLIKMQIGDCETYQVIGGDGQGQKFRKQGSSFVPQRGYHGKLTTTPTSGSEPEGGFNFTTKEGVVYHFGPAVGMAPDAPEIPTSPGNLKYIEDPNGNRLTFFYDQNTQRLTKVQDASGREISFSYSEDLIGNAVRVEKITGPEGLEVNYSYDTFGNLRTVQRGDRFWNYDYSIQPLDLRFRHRLEKVTDPNGNTTSYEYFTENEVFPGESIQPANCDFMEGNCTIVTAKYKVNAVKKITEPSTGGGEPSITTFEYDYSLFSSGEPYGGTHFTKVTDPRQKLTTYVIDFQGAAVEIRQPGDITTKISWNDGDVYKDEEIDANGRKTTYDHDTRGNLLEERVFADDPDTGNQQIVTNYTYESKFNRLTSKTEARFQGTPSNLLHKTTYTIDPDNGNLRSMTDALGHTTTFTYNSVNGNLMQKRDSRNY